MVVEFAAAAEDEQVGVFVSIGVEDHGLHILLILSARYEVAAGKGAVFVLEEQFSGLFEGAADKKIFKPIPVEITCADKGTFLRIFLEDQGLELIVEEKSLFVLEIRF